MNEGFIGFFLSDLVIYVMQKLCSKALEVRTLVYSFFSVSTSTYWWFIKAPSFEMLLCVLHSCKNNFTCLTSRQE